jgi:LEA14-like dessication related protein
MSFTNKAIEVKPYSLTELALIYGVTNRTMKNWIVRHNEAIGEKVGRLYTALQVKIIFEKLGLPGHATD